MDDLTREDFERYLMAMEKSTDVLAKLQQSAPAVTATSGSQHFNVNAGNPAMWIAVWISTICCAIVVTMTWNWREDQTKQVILAAEQEHKLENANDKLSIILQWAPKLAKEVDDQMKQKQLENDHAHNKP